MTQADCCFVFVLAAVSRGTSNLGNLMQVVSLVCVLTGNATVVRVKQCERQPAAIDQATMQMRFNVKITRWCNLSAINGTRVQWCAM
jgi:hypothetical protein